jgi:hypothetical protein
LDTVAPKEGDSMRHAVLLGEARSGRTSVLEEVGRRASEECGYLVVKVQTGGELGRSEFIRQLLTALVEGLAEVVGDGAEWYGAWRDRVYLRRTSAAEDRDILSSALIYAADSTAWVDRAVLERDLTELARIAAEAKMRGVVVCVDDVSPLTEDVTLIEEIVEIFDAAGGYSLLLAGLPTIGRHFRQAASRCLDRVSPIRLAPFGGPQQVFTALSTPLEGEATRYTDRGDLDFLIDVLGLTGGNPYQLMVVGAYLWQSCEQGEQEKYVLTPRVLDRVIPHLAMLASDGDALRDGAEAIDRLNDDQVPLAVELAALSNFSLREIAVARLMNFAGSSDDDLDPDAILGRDVGEELERVRAELDELEEAGVVQVSEDEDHFGVVGGRHASILLKYKARARIGADDLEPIFGYRFLPAVGAALAREMARRILGKVPDAETLGFNSLASDGGLGRVSPRQVVRSFEHSDDIGRLIDSEIEMVPWGREDFERIGELLSADDPTIALFCTGLSNGKGHLEYIELWQVPHLVAHDDVARAVSDVAEDWEKIVAGAELSWSGSQSAVLRGEAARRVLCALQSLVATKSVFDLFDRWREKPEQAEPLRAAIRIVTESIAVMRATGRSDLALSGELSGMLSRLGFLRSFDDGELPAAEEALEEALDSGDAERWITKWNLANVYARRGRKDRALEILREVRDGAAGEESRANVLVFVPGRSAADSLVAVSGAGIESLIQLQLELVSNQASDLIVAAAAECQATEDPGAMVAAEWALESIGLPA